MSYQCARGRVDLVYALGEAESSFLQSKFILTVITLNFPMFYRMKVDLL